MIEASATFSAFEDSLRSLLEFLFSLKQCVTTAAVSLSAIVYELVHELAVSHLCTVRVAYMVYLARLRSAVRCWLACIDCSMMEGSILFINALWALPKPRKVEADWKSLHLYVCALVSFGTFVVINNNFHIWAVISGFNRPCAVYSFLLQLYPKTASYCSYIPAVAPATEYILDIYINIDLARLHNMTAESPSKFLFMC